MSDLNQEIFREYDIRGIADTELTDAAVERITAATAAVFVREKKTRIAVGMDGRPSSERIRSLVSRTLARFGLEVLDIGLVPTPVAYFAVFHLELDGCVMVTASHNPAEYNGLKIMLGRFPVFGAGLQEIYRIAAAGHFPPAGKGRCQSRNLIPGYLDFIASRVKLEKPLKVVIDGGNGTAGITAGPLYRRLGADVTEIFCDVDGRFPNHHPDPTKAENLRELIAAVTETGADAGIAFDGDADRIGVVDGGGRIMWGDQLLVLYARDVLREHPGATIISEVKASEVLYAEIARAGGRPLMWKTGHSLIKQKIHEEHALLAGEMSGHMFFNDRWFGFDDAVYAGARLLELMGRSPLSLREMFDTVPRAVNTPEIRVDTTDAAKFSVVAAVRDHYRRDHEVIDIDGARVKFGHGWALVRASNTQPSLVVRYEADSQPHLDEIRRDVEAVLAEVRAKLEA